MHFIQVILKCQITWKLIGLFQQMVKKLSIKNFLDLDSIKNIDNKILSLMRISYSRFNTKSELDKEIRIIFLKKAYLLRKQYLKQFRSQRIERLLNSGRGQHWLKSNPSAPLNCRVGRSVIVLCSKDFSVSSKKQLFRPFSIA